jgi:hypothetical protein
MIDAIMMKRRNADDSPCFYRLTGSHKSRSANQTSTNRNSAHDSHSHVTVTDHAIRTGDRKPHLLVHFFSTDHDHGHIGSFPYSIHRGRNNSITNSDLLEGSLNCA